MTRAVGLLWLLNPVRRDEILGILRHHRADLERQFGVKSLALFGSVARDEAHQTSDVDILVDFTAPPGFRRYMNLKYRLEELLSVRVDLVMTGALRAEARAIVEQEAVRVA